MGGLEEEHDLIPGSGSTDLHTIYVLFEEAGFETHLLAAPSGTMEDASEGRARSENDQENSDRLPPPDSADKK